MAIYEYRRKSSVNRERAVAGILKMEMPGKEHKHLSIAQFLITNTG